MYTLTCRKNPKKQADKGYGFTIRKHPKSQNPLKNALNLRSAYISGFFSISAAKKFYSILFPEEQKEKPSGFVLQIQIIKSRKTAKRSFRFSPFRQSWPKGEGKGRAPKEKNLKGLFFCVIVTKRIFKLQIIKTRSHLIGSVSGVALRLERITGLEPATFTLGRWRSTGWAKSANSC